MILLSESSVGIIGGADGPTEIYLTGSTGWRWVIIIAAVIIVTAAIIIRAIRKRRR